MLAVIVLVVKQIPFFNIPYTYRISRILRLNTALKACFLVAFNIIPD